MTVPSVHLPTRQWFFFFWGNFAFWGNRFLENLGEIGLGEISSFKNLGETVWGNFMKN